LTVRITQVAPAGREFTAFEDESPTVSAGIVLYPPEKPEAALAFVQQHIRDGNVWKSELCSHLRYNEVVYESVRRPGDKLEPAPLHLRLTRRGDSFTSEWSRDGKKWNAAAVQGQLRSPPRS
jgi:hypothetical protein